MHIVNVVDTFPRYKDSIVNSCIDTYQDIILCHYPLTRTINQLHFTIYLLNCIGARIEVHKPRLHCFNILSKTFINSYEALINCNIGVSTACAWNGTKGSTNFTTAVEIILVRTT